MPLIDLHTHTSFSDSSLTVAELIAQAAQRGVKLLALTDHDTLKGVAQFKKLCQKKGIAAVSGIEISVNYQDLNLHLLVYEPRTALPKVYRYLKEQCQKRRAAAKQVIEQMRQAGFVLPDQKIKELLAKENVGKPHLALAFMTEPLNRALLLNQYNFNSTTATVSDFIQKFLETPSQVGFVKRLKIDAQESIKLMHHCRATVSLAHPDLNIPPARRSAVLKSLIQSGLDGIETSRPAMTPQDQRIFSRWVKKYNLLATAGSDTHGTVHGGGEVGVEIDQAMFQKLKRRLLK